MEKEQRARELGERIRELRKDFGFSLREAAHCLHINPSSLSRIENGLLLPNEMRLNQIADFLGESHRSELFRLAGLIPTEVKENIIKDSGKWEEIYKMGVDCGN